MILISFNTTGLSRFETAQPSFTRIFREKYSAAAQFPCSLFAFIERTVMKRKARLSSLQSRSRCDFVSSTNHSKLVIAAGWYECFCEYFVKENDRKHCRREIGMTKIVRLESSLEVESTKEGVMTIRHVRSIFRIYF